MKKTKQKKPNIYGDKGLRILVALFIVITTILAIVLIINRNHLDTESDEIVELYNYFSSDSLQKCEGLFNYSDELVEYSDVDIENKLCIAYQKANIDDVEIATLKVDKKKTICTLEKGIVFKANENSDECSYSKINKEIIDETYKKLYGKINNSWNR